VSDDESVGMFHGGDIKKCFTTLHISDFTKKDWLRTLCLRDDVGNTALFENMDSRFHNSL
jgi:hypothetical protein